MSVNNEIQDIKDWMKTRDEKWSELMTEQTILKVTQEHIVNSLKLLHTDIRKLVWVGITSLISIIGTIFWLVAAGKLQIIG